jgi:hypothetical protein
MALGLVSLAVRVGASAIPERPSSCALAAGGGVAELEIGRAHV